MVDNDTLKAALAAIGYAMLPAPLLPSHKGIWLRAVARVRLVNGTKAYCLVHNDGGSPSVLQTFGKSVAIASYEEIYPYEELDARFRPRLKDDKAIEEYLWRTCNNMTVVRSLLSTEGKDTERLRRDRAEIERLVLRSAIAVAQKALAEEERCKKIIENGKATERKNAGGKSGPARTKRKSRGGRKTD